MDNNVNDPLNGLIKTYIQLKKQNTPDESIRQQLGLDPNTYSELISVVSEMSNPSKPNNKPAGDVFGDDPTQVVPAASNGGTLALGTAAGGIAGATAGLAFGPIGAGVGFLAGSIYGFFKTKKELKQVEENNAAAELAAAEEKKGIIEQDRQARSKQTLNDANLLAQLSENQQDSDINRALSRNADAYAEGGVVDYSTNLYNQKLKLQSPERVPGVGHVSVFDGKLVPSRLPNTYKVVANNPSKTDSVGVQVGDKRILVDNKEIVAFTNNKAIITRT